MIVGSYAGGYIPTMWGAPAFGFATVIFGAIGGFLGIYIGYRFGE